MKFLEQISYRLQSKRPDGTSDNIEVLKKIFENLSRIEIRTYDQEADRKNYIRYDFFEAIKDFSCGTKNDDIYIKNHSIRYTRRSPSPNKAMITFVQS